MARVVQRRSNPPYLLILFVFLFLIATVVAVLMYLKNEELTQQVASVKADLDQVATTAERTTAKSLLSSLSNAPKTMTSMGYYLAERDKLKGAIVSDSRPDAAAVLMQFDRLAASDPRIKAHGLVPFITVLQEELKAKDSEKAAANQRLELAEEQARNAKEALAGVTKLINDFTVARDRDNAAVKQAIAALGQNDREKWKSIEELMEQQQQAARQQGERAKTDLVKMSREVAALKNQVEEFKENKRKASQQVDVSSMANKPAGKILRVLGDKAYINLGKNDNVQPAMTFGIFPTGPATNPDKIKGTLEVLHVGEATSECRITNTYDDAGPVLIGDIIGNVAYSSNRTFFFVVKGHFDMTGSGKATSEGAAIIRDLIVRSGGKLMDDVNIATDFLIVGQMPPAPPKPDDDAPDSVIEAYHQQMRTIDDFEKSQKAARDFFIPILNDNRFLALVGYQPGKTELPKLLAQDN